jgi:hypothetical protein
MRPASLWIPFDRLLPPTDAMVEVEGDGLGLRRRMRFPCPFYEKMRRQYPDKTFRYRMSSRAEPGDEVLFKYVHLNGDLKGVTEGVITRRDGGYVYCAVEIVKKATVVVFEREVYDSEITVKSDEEFMLLHGEL